MNRVFCFALLMTLGLTAGPWATAAEAPLWTSEAGGLVGFVAKQAGAPVEGRFEAFEAEIRFDPEAPETGQVTVVIDIASVNSESKDRDDTIRSTSLFDVATWPQARFEADSFVARGDGGFDAQGRLTLRDVTKEVTLPFSLEIGDHPEAADQLQAHAVGELDILRLDYGVGQGLWQDTSVVANEVTIKIDIFAKRPKD